jgi:hypothetical protein
MIIVHDTFICKPGQASKLAKLFKESMAGSGEQVAIMTDVTGQFNKVVMASWHKDLAAYEKMLEEYMNPSEESKKKFEKMSGYTDMYQTGSREIYRVW